MKRESVLKRIVSSPFRFSGVVFGIMLCCLAGCSSDGGSRQEACTTGGGMLKVGFYAFFEPVSYSASSDPNAADFNTHRGYEADLLTALEALEGAGLSFSRRAIEHWVDPNTGSGIWLQSARPEYDIVGGGMTILDARTRNAAGEQVVIFTSGHIAFRQTLLVRAEDAGGLASHDDLTSDVRVGVLAGTTGEARLLVLTGITDAEGVLAAGTRVDTPAGTVTADGSMAYVITAAGASPQLEGRQRLYPSSDTMPQVIYLGEETELLAALGHEDIDAVARGEIGNTDAAHDSDGAFVVTAVDPAAEHGGFTVAAEDAALAVCLSEKIDWLTHDRRIGYAEWREDPMVFMQRATMWNQGAR